MASTTTQSVRFISTDRDVKRELSGIDLGFNPLPPQEGQDLLSIHLLESDVVEDELTVVVSQPHNPKGVRK